MTASRERLKNFCKIRDGDLRLSYGLVGWVAETLPKVRMPAANIFVPDPRSPGRVRRKRKDQRRTILAARTFLSMPIGSQVIYED